MSVRRVMGVETEYGISVPGDPTANPMVLSGHVVNAYASGHGVRSGRASWDYADEAPAARRAGLRDQPGARRPDPADRRGGPDPRQRRPHQRRPALRRPRPPGVQLARGHQPARRGDVGPRRRAGHARGGAAAERTPGSARGQPLQEQHRRQGRLLRHPRELPHAARDPVLRHRAPPRAVLRRPPGDLRLGAGRHRPGLAHAGVPAEPALRLLRGGGRTRDDAQTADHQHPRRAPRGRRPLPAPARHHRRRQPRRRGQPAQAGHDLARPGGDRGPGHDARPHAGQAGGHPPCRLPRPHARRPRDPARRHDDDRAGADVGVPRPGDGVPRRPRHGR